MWWWATDGNVGADRSIGHAWVTLGGRAGSGSKEMSNGPPLESDGRWSLGSTVNLEVGRRYPAEERAGVRMEGRLSLTEL